MENFLIQLLKENNIELTKTVKNTLAKLVENAKISELVKNISNIKTHIIEIFNMNKEKEEFKEKHLAIVNANSKKTYDFTIDLHEFPNIVIKEIRNIDATGLHFDVENNRIFGTPTIANTFDLQIVFYNKNDPNNDLDVKDIIFIINADPKDLWKDIPSRQGDLYAKPDEDKYKGDFLDKKIVIASKRGRSHAHDGTFRDDDFCTKSLPNEWAVVAVADGAGSAKYARQGSKIVTEFIVEKFNNVDILNELDKLVPIYFSEIYQEEAVEEVVENETANPPQDVNEVIEEVNISLKNSREENIETENSKTNNVDSEPVIVAKEDLKLNAKRSIVKILYAGVSDLYSELLKFSSDNQFELKHLNSTLVFAICKKFDFGYVVLSFGVGDSPINILNKDITAVQLLNLMDVGEQSGGTRFITMRSIFENQNMGSRFGVNKYEDFSKMFLMTDGIYDPKFVTENRLEDIEVWQKFLKDLDGENEDNAKVDFAEDENIDQQLLNWMDFWSKGNHDDRTLAIIY